MKSEHTRHILARIQAMDAAGVGQSDAYTAAQIDLVLAENPPRTRPTWYGSPRRESVLQYFVRTLRPYIHWSGAEGVQALRDYAEYMHEMPLNSECGHSCRDLIDAWALILCLRYGDLYRQHDGSDFVAELHECGAACAVYIRG
jgi:hypothetical protein